jgi:hypothetical protein
VADIVAQGVERKQIQEKLIAPPQKVGWEKAQPLFHRARYRARARARTRSLKVAGEKGRRYEDEYDWGA